MKCYLCGTRILYWIWSYGEPDKYLKAIGITKSRRTWHQCPKCELYINDNGLTEEQTEQAYLKYRNYEMRGATVKEEFDRVKAIPYSENQQRINWLLGNGVFQKKTVLDIGSGLGIFPYQINPYVDKVYCIEPEPESAQFIDKGLGIECHQGFYETGLFPKVDLVTLVHVLEHIHQPINFLKGIREIDLKKDGILFVEVPDATEFQSLDKDNDEFNSLHLWFFNLSTLDRVIRKSGFVPFLAKRVYYEHRKLHRIMMLCR